MLLSTSKQFMLGPDDCVVLLYSEWKVWTLILTSFLRFPYFLYYYNGWNWCLPYFIVGSLLITPLLALEIAITQVGFSLNLVFSFSGKRKLEKVDQHI